MTTLTTQNRFLVSKRKRRNLNSKQSSWQRLPRKMNLTRKSIWRDRIYREDLRWRISGNRPLLIHHSTAASHAFCANLLEWAPGFAAFSRRILNEQTNNRRGLKISPYINILRPSCSWISTSSWSFLAFSCLSSSPTPGKATKPLSCSAKTPSVDVKLVRWSKTCAQRLHIIKEEDGQLNLIGLL